MVVSMNGTFRCPAPLCDWAWKVGEQDATVDLFLLALSSPSQRQQMAVMREHQSLARAFGDHVRSDHKAEALMVELLRLHEEVGALIEGLPPQVHALREKLRKVLVGPDQATGRWLGLDDEMWAKSSDRAYNF